MSHPVLREVDALLFDLDGTLVDSYDAIHESLGVAMQEKGLAPLPYPEVRRMVGRGLESLVEEAMGAENVAEGVARFRGHYRTVFLHKTRLLPGVAGAIGRLRSAGKRLAICTNKLGSFSTELVHHLGIGHHFVAVLGPESVSRPKPDPEMLRRALELVEATAARTLYVGDMPMDVAVARAAGVRVVVVPTGSAAREELDVLEPDLLVEDLGELAGAVLGSPSPATA